MAMSRLPALAQLTRTLTVVPVAASLGLVVKVHGVAVPLAVNDDDWMKLATPVGVNVTSKGFVDGDVVATDVVNVVGESDTDDHG